MAFDWLEYLEFARRVATSDLEAARRSAISQAYYAVFHVAEAKCPKANRPQVANDNTFSHHQVWEWYTQKGDRRYQQIGRKGFRLRNERVGADYHSDFRSSPEQVQFALREAEAILGYLATVPESSSSG